MKTFASFILCAFFFQGCNVFDFMSSPSYDQQYLSLARACLDDEDYDCAEENFNALSISFNSEKQSGLAFATLGRAGMSMKEFIKGFGTTGKSAGRQVTIIADQLAAKGGLGSSKRQNIFGAYTRVRNLTDDPSTRGLVRLITAYSLLAEILAENNGGDGTLTTSDVNGISAGASIDYTTASATDLNATLGAIDGAINEIGTAIGASELGGTGKFSDKANAIFTAQESLDPNGVGDGAVYKAGLIAIGVGEQE